MSKPCKSNQIRNAETGRCRKQSAKKTAAKKSAAKKSALAQARAEASQAVARRQASAGRKSAAKRKAPAKKSAAKRKAPAKKSALAQARAEASQAVARRQASAGRKSAKKSAGRKFRPPPPPRAERQSNKQLRKAVALARARGNRQSRDILDFVSPDDSIRNLFATPEFRVAQDEALQEALAVAAKKAHEEVYGSYGPPSYELASDRYGRGI